MTEGDGDGDSVVQWSRRTRDLWFYGVLAASAVGVAVLFSPFAYVLLFASTTVVVTWPIYERVLRRCWGNRALAAGVTTVILALVVFGPLSVLGWMFVTEAIVVVDQLGAWLSSGAPMRDVQSLIDDLPVVIAMFSDYLPEGVIPEDFDPVAAVVAPAQSGMLGALNAVGAKLPQLVNSLVSASLHAVIFVFAVVSLYMEGPRVLRVLANLSPMDDAYDAHLFRVFREFANNMVLGSLATATLQGLVASVGYVAAGVERVVFLGILTGVFSFVPLVGTAVIWVPVTLYVAVKFGWAWAAGLALWNLLVTGSVDNIVKPLFLRGNSNIHPLLIFLAVFGGLYWMSVPGVLVGPVLVAMFLALYTIYCQDQLGQTLGLPQAQPALLERLLALVDPPAAAPPEPPAAVLPPEPPAVGPSVAAAPEALPQEHDAQVSLEPPRPLGSEPGAPPRTMAQGSQSDDVP